MRKIRFTPALLVSALGVWACAKQDPSGATSVYLSIDNGPGLGVPEELRLTVYGDNGTIFDNQRIPETGPFVPPAGAASLLGTVTLYVGGGVTQARVEVRGYLGGVMRSQGITRVSVIRDRQVPAQVLLQQVVANDPDGGSDAGRDATGAEAIADAGVPHGDGGAEDTGSVPDGATGSDGQSGGADAGTQHDADVDAGDDAGAGGERPETEGGGAGCQGSSLTGLVEVPSSPVDLTAEGLIDWRHWGLGGAVDYKRTAGGEISDYALVGNGTIATRFRANLTFSWSDGSPTFSATAVDDGMTISGVGNGVELTVPADAAQRTLAVYVSGENDTGLFTASLSDGCVADYAQPSSNGRQGYDAVYRIGFRSARPGTRLRVTWMMTAGFEAIGLYAATLY